ncbi:MAG TPA: SURF1 family protein [Gammaproteobacteria bacterium]|nr:SURF1 family protein [Gammaproteobacteria bacterium]
MLTLSFRLSKLRFEFNIGFAVLVLAVCAVMLRAGYWQLDRAAEKIRMQQQIEEAQIQPVLHIFGDLPAPESLRYRQIRITGYYRNEHQFLLDNKVRSDSAGAARVGYHVITPFVTDAGTLLVDRGWVALGMDRNRLPEVAVDTGERNITGTVTLPERGFHLGAIDSDWNWPRLIQFVDYELLGHRLDSRIYPATIVLAAGSEDAYEYDWRPTQAGPQKHYSYATQWFLMCGAMVVLFIWFSARRIET